MKRNKRMDCFDRPFASQTLTTFYHFVIEIPLVFANKHSNMLVFATTIFFKKAPKNKGFRTIQREYITRLRNRRLVVRILWGVLNLASPNRAGFFHAQIVSSCFEIAYSRQLLDDLRALLLSL